MKLHNYKYTCPFALSSHKDSEIDSFTSLFCLVGSTCVVVVLERLLPHFECDVRIYSKKRSNPVLALRPRQNNKAIAVDLALIYYIIYHKKEEII